MTKEEKAKAYDEAFEKAKFYYKNCPSEAEKKKLEKMFPKFRESEDERIRKEIISLVKMYVSENDHCLVRGGNTTRKEALAWLEKQKTLFSSGAGLYYYYDGKATYVVGYPATAEYDLAMNQQETQKEQKPDIELIQRSWYMEGYHDGEFGNEPKWLIKTGEGGPKYELNRQYGQPLTENPKNAEWSEKAQTIIEGACNALEIHGHSKLAEKLKSLRPQPKQNANGMITPNKEFFHWIYDRLVNIHKENPNVDYMISFKRRIEELSFDRPHWKPSEEQIEALEKTTRFANFGTDAKRRNALLSLYEQLKKLM